MIKLHSFINTFHLLWKAGETAHLNLDTHAGQAWIGIRTPLGYYAQTHQYHPNTPQTHNTHTQHPPHTPQTPTHQQHHAHTKAKRSPSYFRRLHRRKTDRATNNTTTDTNPAENVQHTDTLAEQANHIITQTAQVHLNSTEQVEHITTPAEKAASTTPPAEQADQTITPAEQAYNNTTNNNTSTAKVDYNHQQTISPTAQVEHTTTCTTSSYTPNNNTTTHNIPEVTDDDIRINYKKLSNVMQRPLSAEEITHFKRIMPNPNEEEIVEICQFFIKARLKYIGALSPITTTQT